MKVTHEAHFLLSSKNKRSLSSQIMWEHFQQSITSVLTGPVGSFIFLHYSQSLPISACTLSSKILASYLKCHLCNPGFHITVFIAVTASSFFIYLTQLWVFLLNLWQAVNQHVCLGQLFIHPFWQPHLTSSLMPSKNFRLQICMPLLYSFMHKAFAVMYISCKCHFFKCFTDSIVEPYALQKWWPFRSASKHSLWMTAHKFQVSL